LEVTALRYFNVYGPRQNPESDYAAVIPIFINTLLNEEEPVIYGDGKQSRDFIYVEDVVQANILASESSQAPGQIINVCSGEEIDLLTLIGLLSDIYQRKIDPTYQDIRPGDIYRSLGDPSLAEKILDFQPRVSLTEGLEKTSAWMKKK
jgi:UDP-glucose 4-epimerase